MWTAVAISQGTNVEESFKNILFGALVGPPQQHSGEMAAT